MERKSSKSNYKKIVLYLVIVVAIIYILYTIYLLIKQPTSTFTVEEGKLYQEETNIGYVIRDEKVVKGENYKNGMEQIKSEGERAAVNENIFRYYSSNEESLKQNLKEGFYRSTKDEMVFVEFWRFNTFFKNKWKNFEDFLKRPLSVQAEIKWRNKLFGTYNLSPIIILENILPSRYEVIAKSEIYHDNQEVLVEI